MSLSRQTWLPARRCLAALLLAHLLAVLALAASPGLHHWVHADADADDHDCAVVLFTHGGANESVGPVPVPGFVVLTVGFSPQPSMADEVFVPTVFAVGAVFEHGPPMVDARRS